MALAVAEPKQMATIPFGTRDEVKELQTRIIHMMPSLMPNASQLSHDEAMALAQVALAHGLSPFNNEIYYLKSGDRNLGVFPGIRGYRKAAHRQIRREGGSYWLSEPMRVDARAHGGEDGDICTVFELRDSVTMGEYLKLRGMIFTMNRLPDNILTLAKEESEALTILRNMIENTSLEILGKPPVTFGVGIVKKFEAENRLKKAGLSPTHISAIRAERAALRKRFDLDLVFGGNDETWQEADTFDAAAEIVEDVTAETDAPQSHEKNMADLGFEKSKSQPIWTVAQKQALISTGLAKNDFAAKGMLGLSCLHVEATNEEIIKWGSIYRKYRDMKDENGKEVNDSKSAAEKSNTEYKGQ